MPVRRDDEAGFSLVELMLTVALLGLVLGVLFSALTSLQATDARVQRLANNQERVRVAMTRLSRDLRSATDVLEPSSPAVAPYEIGIKDYKGNLVCWKLTGTTLVRLTAACSATGGANQLTNVRNKARALPLFKYYRAGSQTELSLATTSKQDLAKCVAHINLTISADVETGPVAFTAESDVDLRNRQREGTAGC